MSFTEKDAERIARKYLPFLKISANFMMSGIKGKKPEIEVDCFRDGCYYNSEANIIHLDTSYPLKFYGVKNEQEYLACLDFSLSHEILHLKCTAIKPYGIAISHGVHSILEYIGNATGLKKRFRSESDYNDFVNRVLPENDIFLNYDGLESFVACIANSLCDGRIERIGCKIWGDFSAKRKFFNGKNWDLAPCKSTLDDVYASDTAYKKLIVISNQILDLATCNLYQKGFFVEFAGNELIREVEAFKPDIKSAITSSNTRGLIRPVENICRKLAPYLLEAFTCKISERQKAEEMLKKMLEEMAKHCSAKNEGGVSEQDEYTEDTTDISSVFGHSDLEVTLNDEAFDKLTENQPKSDSDKSSGLKVKREHQKTTPPIPKPATPPKKPEENSEHGSESGEDSTASSPENGSESGSKGSKSKSKAENNGESGSSDGSDYDEDSENEGSSGGSDGSDYDEDGENEGSSGGSDGSDYGEDGENEGSSGDSDGSDYGEDGENEGSSGSSDGSDYGEDSENEGSSGNSDGSEAEKSGGKAENANSNANSSGGGNNIDFESVLREMEEAAKKIRSDAEKIISNVNAYNNSASAKNRGTTKDVPSKDEPVTQKDVENIFKGSYYSFKEVTREYKLASDLSPVLAKRGNVLRRRNEAYFRSLSTPTRRYLENGSIDAGRITGLAFGDTQIFRKNGVDRRFDGCAYILVDNSGSMSGDKRTEACKAAAVIEEAFRGLIPIKIVAFDENSTVIHEVIKGFDEQQRKNCCWNFCLYGRNGGGNEDGYDIMVATQELLKRPEKKKLLLVLSDGAPANRELVKSAVKSARSKGVTVNSIYFTEGCISQRDISSLAYMYEKDYVCCELDKLDAQLQRLFKNFSRS